MVSLSAPPTPWSPSLAGKENRYFGSRNQNKPVVGQQATGHNVNNNNAFHLCATHHIISTHPID